MACLAAGSLERIIVVAAWGGKGASIVESSDHGDGNGFRRRVGDGEAEGDGDELGELQSWNGIRSGRKVRSERYERLENQERE